MTEFVGVVDPFIFAREEGVDITPLKRHALIFNRLAIPHLAESFLADMKSDEGTYITEEIRWLCEAGIIFEPGFDMHTEVKSPEHEEELESSVHHALGLLGVIFGVDVNRIRESKRDDGPDLSDEEMEETLLRIKRITKLRKADFKKAFESQEFLNHVRLMTLHQTRMASIALREADNLDAYPILSTTIPHSQKLPTHKNEVIRIVLDALPVPDDSTPWEQILEFRSDPDSYNKFVDLRNWMTEVARAELNANEVMEKLEYLMSQYQRHMELHRMKMNKSSFETIVVTTGELLENLARLKFGDLAKIPFSIRHRQISLLEGELTSPGSEVAYIVKARETF